MSRQPKYAKATDANQAEIVRLLNELPNVQCEVIGSPVDLLIGVHRPDGRYNFIVELKDSGKKKYEHRYTEKQQKFLKDWPGQVRVATTFEEIMALLFDSYQ